MFRSRLSSRSTTMTVAILGPVLALSLSACGGGSSSSSAAATPTARPTGAPGNGQRGGFAGADFTKIQACLKAAGIAVPTRSAFPRPSGSFSPRPRPSGSARPTGGFGGRGRGGAGGGQFANPQTQAALKACGITFPAGGGARPTTSPTS